MEVAGDVEKSTTSKHLHSSGLNPYAEYPLTCMVLECWSGQVFDFVLIMPCATQVSISIIFAPYDLPVICVISSSSILANKSSDILQQASVTAQATPPASKDMLSTDKSKADLCPLGKIIQEGNYPITNFFSPQYSVLVANFLLRRQARISLQVSMVEDFPSVIVDLSCSKSTLKKYHRRPRNTTPKHSHHMQLRSSVDWVASPPLAKSRKLNHVEDINLDTKRNLVSKSDVPTLRKRKGRELNKETHTLAFGDAAKKSPTVHLKSDWKGKKPCSKIAQLEPRDTVVKLKGWKLSKDEEIALSTLSSGLRESGLIHLSHSQ